MRNLLDFLSRHNHWFVFILLEVLSLVLLFRHNSYQGSVWFSSANVVAGKVYELNSAIDQYFSLIDVNGRLTQRNIYLERQVSELSERLSSYASQDTTMLEKLQMQAVAGLRMIPAKVVANSVDKNDNFMTIDKGSADGVRKDMGIVSGSGVVGIVYLVSEHYSVVIPVLNSHSNISCTIRGRGYFGYLHWDGGSSADAYVDDVPRHARFRKGDIVVTSGYSSVFPKGIMVGTITQVYNSVNGMSYRLKVRLSTDFASLRDVCVISDDSMKEKQEIMNAALDSIKPKS
ncbi:MAG: rod shape-determining protein MreC [Prevotella sp.]